MEKIILVLDNRSERLATLEFIQGIQQLFLIQQSLNVIHHINRLRRKTILCEKLSSCPLMSGTRQKSHFHGSYETWQ